MPAYALYKAFHIFGVLLVFISLGAALGLARVGAGGQPHARRVLAITHGVGILVVLVAGMGLVARLGIPWPFAGWLWGKIAIWIVLGGLLTLALRRVGWSRLLWWATPLLGLVAAWLAIAKP